MTWETPVKITSGSDLIDGAVPTIDLTHHEIHEGHYYSATKRKDAAGTNEMFIVTVPAGGTYGHAVFNVESTLGALVSLYENPTITLAGSNVPVYSKNRQVGGTGAITVTHIEGTLGTVSALGSLLEAHVFGSDKGATNIGGAVRVTSEFILNSPGTYLTRVESFAAAGTVCWNAEWYEVH